MSELYVPLVTCDKCKPGEIVTVENGVLPAQEGLGWCLSYGIEQLLERGWEERDYGHICPACVAVENMVAEQDAATEVVHGAVVNPVEAMTGMSVPETQQESQ